MSRAKYSHEQLVSQAKLNQEDLVEINRRRQPHNRLGFAYQLARVMHFTKVGRVSIFKG